VPIRFEIVQIYESVKLSRRWPEPTLMGFGSYDESEQEQPSDTDEDDGETVNAHENEYDGELSVDSDASTDELIDQLGEIKADEPDAADSS